MAISLAYPLISQLCRSLFATSLSLHSDVEAFPAPSNLPNSLYLHIPFCESLCTYCTFHKQIMDEPLSRAYFGALRKDIQRTHAAGYTFNQVYFGGGTPAVLIDELVQTIELVNTLFDDPTVSVETNPNHLVHEKMEPLIGVGVDRLSVGVQTFDNNLLNKMNRFQPYGDAQLIKTRIAQFNNRFPTFNVDMIFNLPGQTNASLEEDLEILKELQVAQISWHPLISSDANKALLNQKMGHYSRATEKKMFDNILHTLTLDYKQDSVWCFSKDAEASVDEYIATNDQYLGLGSGVFSCQEKTLFASTFSILEYIEKLRLDQPTAIASRTFGKREWLSFKLMLKLHSMNLTKSVLFVDFDDSNRQLLKIELLGLKTIGAVREYSDHFELTDKGKYLALTLMKETLIAVDQLRQRMIALNADD